MEKPRFKNIYDCFKKTVHSEGVVGLFKGINVCMIRSVPTNGFGFLAFEEVRKFIEFHYEKYPGFHLFLLFLIFIFFLIFFFFFFLCFFYWKIFY